jgi:hypothetical protein
MVRVSAAKEHLKRNKNRRTGSAIHLRPLKSSHSSKRHVKGSKSQSQFHPPTKQQQDEEVDYEVEN